LNPNDFMQRRDLGVSLLHAGQPGRAIGHLIAYLTADPNRPDAGSVRQLLNRAYQAVGRWN
jgi:hypothetical protein